MLNFDFYYLVAGFDNGRFLITAKFTFTELANNEGPLKDTELFYSLQESGETFTTLELNKPQPMSINRDSDNSPALIVRVDQKTYRETEV